MLRALEREEIEALRAFIENAPEGSPIDEARKFGVDFDSILENLKLTPAERFRRATEETEFVRRVRGASRKADS